MTSQAQNPSDVSGTMKVETNGVNPVMITNVMVRLPDFSRSGFHGMYPSSVLPMGFMFTHWG